MLPTWAIPIIVQAASKVIDYAFECTEKKRKPVKDTLYDEILNRDRKAYGKMRGMQHV